MTWARLLKRVFDIDIERCACGGKLKLVAVIEEPAVIEKILTHLGLASRRHELKRGGWNCLIGIGVEAGDFYRAEGAAWSVHFRGLLRAVKSTG